jgi:hypothetical protein
MTQIWKIINWIILGTQMIICALGTFYKHIAFGWGLGDLLWYGIMYILLITHLIITIRMQKQKSLNYLPLVLFFTITTIFICLRATIWRGVEYRWNGEIFYNN